MNNQEANILISAIAAGDNRTTDDEVAAYWARILHDVRLPDALEAVVHHRRESTEYLQPAHILRTVRSLRQRRIGAANIVYEPIGEETGRQFLERVGALIRAAGDGRLENRPVRLALVPAGLPPVVPPDIEAAIERTRAARAAASVRCPHCNAAPGQSCAVGRGHRAGFMHPSRVDARSAS